MIKFNVPCVLGCENEYLQEALKRHSLGGDGFYTKKCNQFMEEKFQASKVHLTTSCSTALDAAALLCDLKEGDEVILPSYTFPTSASCFALRGAKCVFVDIRPDTLNIDETKIEAAITDWTKVICVVHYAGVACEMDTIMDIAKRHGLLVVEDAAQGVMSKYKGQYLGTIGDFGCYSFHETKNYTSGEGGALIIKDKHYFCQAENILDCGTDRQGFLRGEVGAYSWVTLGSSFMMSELSAAYLYGQLLHAEEINENRLKSWNLYYEGLSDLKTNGKIVLPFVPVECEHNAHMFAIRVKDKSERSSLIQFLKEHEIQAVFHYQPLHSSKEGKQCGTFFEEDQYTTKESERLLRLPLYYGITEEEIHKIIKVIHDFYQ